MAWEMQGIYMLENSTPERRGGFSKRPNPVIAPGSKDCQT
jgi:hypothetical protein